MSTEKRPDITFYIYNYDDNLMKRPTKIYSPFNVISEWRTPAEDTYRNPKSVLFAWWAFLLSLDNVSEQVYDETKEFLSFSNPVWGKLTKWVGKAENINWTFYNKRWVYKISMEVLNQPKAKVVTRTVKESIQQIPLIIAESMSMPQLEKLAGSWNIELPKDLKEKWSAKDISDIIIKIMTENWNIS